MEEHVLEQSNPHQGGRNGKGEEKGRETEGERGHPCDPTCSNYALFPKVFTIIYCPTKL